MFFSSEISLVLIFLKFWVNSQVVNEFVLDTAQDFNAPWTLSPSTDEEEDMYFYYYEKVGDQVYFSQRVLAYLQDEVGIYEHLLKEKNTTGVWTAFHYHHSADPCYPTTTTSSTTVSTTPDDATDEPTEEPCDTKDFPHISFDPYDDQYDAQAIVSLSIKYFATNTSTTVIVLHATTDEGFAFDVNMIEFCEKSENFWQECSIKFEDVGTARVVKKAKLELQSYTEGDAILVERVTVQTRGEKTTPSTPKPTTSTTKPPPTTTAISEETNATTIDEDRDDDNTTTEDNSGADKHKALLATAIITAFTLTLIS